MKRLTLFILAIIVLAFAALLSGCGHTHEFGEWTTLKEATCTEEGVQERVCACGEKETQAIPTKEHTFGEWTTLKEATCTEEGVQERVCACGEKETQAIPTKGHTFGEWTTVKEATCTEEGVQERVCACGERETQAILATGHTFGEWTTVKEVTCTETGERERVCSCGEKETMSILAYGHEWGAATCTAPKTCKRCGATIGTALGHNYKNGSCTRCGEKAGATFFMPYVGNSYTYYYSSGKVCSICQITWIDTPRVLYDYDPQKMWYKVKVAMTSTYNAKGNNYSSAPKVGYKVYDVNGVIVKSGTIYGENIAVGETCYAEFEVYYVEAGHTYTIEFSNVQG